MSKNLLFAAVIGAAAALAGCATPGSTAADQGNAAQLQRILAQPNHGGEDLSRLMSLSVMTDNCVECVRVLFEADPHPEKGGTDLDTLLAFAASPGHVKMAELLYDHGAEPIAAMALVHHYGLDSVTAEQVFKKIAEDRGPRSASSSAAVNSSSSTAPAAPTPPGGSAAWWQTH